MVASPVLNTMQADAKRRDCNSRVPCRLGLSGESRNGQSWIDDGPIGFAPSNGLRYWGSQFSGHISLSSFSVISISSFSSLRVPVTFIRNSTFILQYTAACQLIAASTKSMWCVDTIWSGKSDMILMIGAGNLFLNWIWHQRLKQNALNGETKVMMCWSNRENGCEMLLIPRNSGSIGLTMR